MRRPGRPRRRGYHSGMNANPSVPMLTDDEIQRLDELLEAANPEGSMVLEEVDGFFAALACSPEPVPAAEYLPLVTGTDPGGPPPAPELLKLLERHWNAVAGQLYEGESFAPVLSYDEDGRASGNAWAIGFVRGMAMRPDAWNALDDDEEFTDVLDPMMVLVEEVEHDEDETPEPIDDDDRKLILEDMFGAVMDVYAFFREARERALAPAAPLRRTEAKVGRNDPCPCGSGRKYKLCHGSPQA